MLLEDATPRQLEQAAALNHTVLFRQEATALGGSIMTNEGLQWTSGSENVPSMVPFPALHAERAGEQLDALIAFYQRHPPKAAGCWSLDQPQPADLGVRLLARGFQPGWRPRWMALDLRNIQTRYPYPEGLTIVRDNTTSLDRIKDLPYAQVIIPAAHSAEMPGQWTRFVARWEGKIVAHSVVFLSTGPYGAAGIYHVGVVPRARRLGIGKAVTLAACLLAREKGYRYAVLNSTEAGRRTYEQLGFVTVGEGYTWWLLTHRLLAHPPSPKEVTIAEAVGRADLAALQQLRPRYTVSDAAYTVLDAWDLGWKERASQKLRADPSAVNMLYGEWDKTLLHFAAERNDQDLTRLVLSAAPNLELRDKAYQATALNWARHFDHGDIVALIEAHSPIPKS
jgi:GNAT superfamily N-acetyltransferase